jgi:hypothetical protein
MAMTNNFKTAPEKRYFEDYIAGAVDEFGSSVVKIAARVHREG